MAAQLPFKRLDCNKQIPEVIEGGKVYTGEKLIFQDQTGQEIGYIFPYWQSGNDLHIDVVLNEVGKKKWKLVSADEENEGVLVRLRLKD